MSRAGEGTDPATAGTAGRHPPLQSGGLSDTGGGHDLDQVAGHAAGRGWGNTLHAFAGAAGAAGPQQGRIDVEQNHEHERWMLRSR